MRYLHKTSIGAAASIVAASTFFIVLTSMMLTAAYAQEEPASEPPAVAPSASTAPSAELAINRLQVSLRPMKKDALASELDNWLGALQQTITEIGEVELQLMDLGEESGEASDLESRLVELRTEELALVERSKVVVAALEKKGGDVAEAKQYIDAVSGFDATVDSPSRAASIIAAVKAWVTSPEGGQALLKRIGLALVILIVFWIISRYAGRLVSKALSRREGVSNLLTNFAKRTAGGLAFLIGVLMALGALGVEIGPLMAAMGAGGFIVGFALQETLGSFASGLMIMIYRPFDVEDYVSLAGVEGTVQELSLVSTTLLSIDNKVLIIPNKAAWGGTITNYTGRDLRRVDLEFGIGYDDDLRRAIEVLREVAEAHSLTLDEPAPSVEVVALADSSVNLCCRPWVKTSDYWKVYWDLTREVKLRLDDEGISIPFPQRDVHIQGGPLPEEKPA